MMAKTLTVLLAILSLVATIILVALLIASRAEVADMPFATSLRCYLEIDDDCLAARMRDLRAERAAIRKEITRLQAERTGILDGTAVHSHSSDLGGWYVRVSAFYDDPDGRTGLHSAFCHAARDVSGPDHGPVLARLENGHVISVPVDADMAAALKFSVADIAKGRAACPWPAIS